MYERIPNKEKTSQFSAFALSHMEAMRLLRNFGLLGDKAGGRLEGKERSYRNIAEHCLVVGMVADTILEKFSEKGYLTAEERQIGVKAALIHDLTKRQELEIEHGVEKGSPKTFLDPEHRKEFISQVLAKHRVSEKDIDDFSLTRLTGDGLLELDEKHIVITTSPRELIRWIILLSDYMVAHTSIVSPQERMDEAQERGEYDELQRWWFEKLYGKQALTEAENKNDVGRILNTRILFFLQQVEDQCRDALEIDAQQPFSDYIKQEIRKRYTFQS
ncbi:MAG: hypothetical protein HY445_03265 [Candidatus Niyogibacteria bacterium]|nr:hypothetical protein [Candidatus Niyogibacteria bacterium]